VYRDNPTDLALLLQALLTVGLKSYPISSHLLSSDGENAIVGVAIHLVSPPHTHTSFIL
jgi:hypothetical protein